MIWRNNLQRYKYTHKVGDVVRAVREIQTGLCNIPAGTVFTVQKRFQGLELLADPCEHCGVQMRASKVQESSVEAFERPDDKQESLL